MDFGRCQSRLKDQEEADPQKQGNPASARSFEKIELAAGVPARLCTLSRKNEITAALVVTFLIFAPVPAGSNRPLPWLIAALAMGAIALFHGIGSALSDKTRKPAILRHKLILGLGLATILGGAFQIVPLFSEGFGGLPTRTISLSPGATLFALLRYATYLLLFAVVLDLGANAERVGKMANWLFYGLLTQAIYALVALSFFGDALYPWEKTSYIGYATGTFVNRNSFAAFMGMGFILGVGLMMQRANALRMRMPRGSKAWSTQSMDKLSFGLLTAILLAAILASQSRMGLFSTFCGALTTYVLLARKYGSGTSKLLVSAIGASFALGVATTIMFRGDILERAIFTASDIESRLTLYAQTLRMIRLRPWTGFGLDSFPHAFELFHHPDLSIDLVWDRAHNTYLALWSEMGVVLGSMPMIIVAVALLAAIANYRRRSRGFTMPAVAIGVIVLGAVHSSVDFSLEIAANVYMFTALVGLGVARFRSPCE